jgi:hypothetical protein
MLHMGSEGQKAPVNVYPYALGLDGRLRALASWPDHLDALLVLG